jgi:hypothetical protein
MEQCKNQVLLTLRDSDAILPRTANFAARLSQQNPVVQICGSWW